ncbi:OmpW family outer membrane protein [Roseovarius salis]|uniref:OmpW/AlkL family protein n=1 Tax=Roseovarius salis TaxID=3376063 RepID=UPI0037C93F15
MKTLTALTLSTALAAFAAPAFAQSQGDMLLGLGAHGVLPTDDYSATLAGPIRVDDNIRPTLTFEYFVADNIGLEVLAAWPFEHDVQLAGVGDVAETKHLPPTVSIQYYFTNQSTITPFVGAGVNYTHFWDETGKGALAGVPVSLDDSWGVAVHAGIDFALSDNASLRTDIRWIDIDTDATVGGAPIGSVSIDPIVVGAAYVYKF